jgi:hypothetical protein
MSAQNRYATLESDLMGKGADAAPALQSRRRTPERLTGRAALSVAHDAAADAPTTATAGDPFYDKGTASAANFRPSYWTYDKNTAAEAAPAQPVASHEPAAIDEAPAADIAPPALETEPELPAAEEAVAEEPPAVIGMPCEPELPPAVEAVAEEPPAVIGLPSEPAATASHQPAAADELAATIEHVLGSRYAGARAAPASTEKPRLAAATVTADTLMAELAEARQARVGDTKAATLRRTVRAPKKATSLLDRAFALGGVALVLFALVALSPWRDSVLPPALATFFH